MSDNILVAVRVRPLITREVSDASAIQWQTGTDNTITQIDPATQKALCAPYTFGRFCFWEILLFKCFSPCIICIYALQTGNRFNRKSSFFQYFIFNLYYYFILFIHLFISSLQIHQNALATDDLNSCFRSSL